jgi:hypothetical protein
VSGPIVAGQEIVYTNSLYVSPLYPRVNTYTFIFMNRNILIKMNAYQKQYQKFIEYIENIDCFVDELKINFKRKTGFQKCISTSFYSPFPKNLKA